MDDTASCREQYAQKAKSRRYEKVVPVSHRTPYASPLIVGDKKYEGQYVALRSFQDRTIITSGPDRAEVRARAIDAGCVSPVIQYIPKGETSDPTHADR